MKVQSTRLGEIEVAEKDILYFPEGLLGFSTFGRYAWLNSVSTDLPIELLQSLDDPDLTFIITDPFIFKKDYSFDVKGEWKDKLDIHRPEQIVVRSVVTVRSNNQTSTNLIAPLIINTERNKAAQIILDNPEYTIQYLIGEGERDVSTNKI